MSTIFPILQPSLIPIFHQTEPNVADFFAVRRIYCVGRNYADHAKEMGFDAREAPFFFMKPADATVVALPNQIAEIKYPPQTQNLHHEVELVVAIGEGGRDIAVAKARQHVYGFALGLDMTRRDLQFALRDKGRPWDVAKGFDQSAPIGPIVRKELLPDIDQAEISLSVNGEVRQQSCISQLIWSVDEIIANLSTYFELQPGDLIFTGTPAGVSAVNVNDLMMADLSGLASISVRVVAT